MIESIHYLSLIVQEKLNLLSHEINVKKVQKNPSK